MSLLAWYPLISNGNNQGLDGIDLTTVGTVTYTAGKLGNAATFNGNTANRFRRTNFTEQTNWSVAAWVKCVGVNSSNNAQWVFNNGRDSNNDGWHCYFNTTGTTLWLRIGDKSWSMASTLDTWYHVCMTIDDNSKYTFYVNGAQVSTGTVATLPDYSESGNLMAIGGFVYNGGNIHPLNGQVQDFRYYNHVLSKKEVKELSKGLCLHLPLDWGGNPNMIKNSYTWMNKNTGSNNQWTNSGLTYDSSTVIENDTAPCRWVMKRVITNTKTSNVSGAGCFYGIGAKGLTTTDLTENEYYTYSFWAKSDSGVSSGFTAGSVVEGQTLVSNTGFGALNGNWRLHTVTFKFTKTTSLTNCFYVTVPASSTVDFQVCGLKLEKGQKATPYLPNVEETAYINNNYGSTVTEDVSGYGNNGVLGTGISSNSSTPRYSTSTAFTNTNGGITQIRCPLNNSSTDLSISCWIYLNETTTNKAIYNARTATGAGISVFTLNNPNGIRFDTGNTMTTFSYSFTANTWFHLVVTKTPTEKNIYINGELKQTVSANTTMTNVAEKGSIGVSSASNTGTSMSSNYFNGSMSDFRLYATALSADDVKELYQVGAQIDKSGNFYCGTLVEV